MARSRLLTLVGVTLALVFVAGQMQAQDEAKKGMGRRGAGFAAGPMFGGMGQGKTMLLANPQVQKELNLTEEQKTKITEVRRGMMPGRGAGRNATPEERKAEAEKRKTAAADADKKIADILKPEQMKRLNGIFIQTGGAQALKDKAVAKELSITEEQTKKIDAAIKTGDEKRREMFQGGARGADTREKMEKLQKDTLAAALEALTADQKKKYDEMKGKEFKLEPMQPRTGGAGGRRGARKGADKADKTEA